MNPLKLVGRALMGPDPVAACPANPGEAVAECYADFALIEKDFAEFDPKDSPGPISRFSSWCYGPTTHRLRFVKWVVGCATHAPLNRAILTGPFSGCYCFTIRQGATSRVYHVGTGSGPAAADLNDRVKTGFREVIAAGGAAGVKGIDPARQLPSAGDVPEKVQRAGLSGGPETFVLVTADGEMWCMTLIRMLNDLAAFQGYYVVAAKKAVPRSWAEISGDDLWSDA